MASPSDEPLKLRASASQHSSPLVAQLPPERRPIPEPACASCPASLWRLTPTRIECVCLKINRVSWDGRQEPTLFCDGREAAIARLAEEMA